MSYLDQIKQYEIECMHENSAEYAIIWNSLLKPMISEAHITCELRKWKLIDAFKTELNANRAIRWLQNEGFTVTEYKKKIDTYGDVEMIDFVLVKWN